MNMTTDELVRTRRRLITEERAAARGPAPPLVLDEPEPEFVSRRRASAVSVSSNVRCVCVVRLATRLTRFGRRQTSELTLGGTTTSERTVTMDLLHAPPQLTLEHTGR